MKQLENFVNDITLDSYYTVYEGKVQEYNGKRAKIEWAVDEPVDNDAEEDAYDDPETTDSYEDLLDKFDVQEPFFIIGRAGWGKTSTIKSLAKKYHRTVITVYLDKAEAVDLGGIPVPVSGKTKIVANAKDLATGKVKQQEFAKQVKALPPWAALMLENPDTDYLLFFDEMNQAQPDVMNALMPIVLDNTICEIQFDNFFVGAAGNFEDENQAGINELSGPLKSRFKPLITWDADTPQAWASAFKYLHKKWDKYLTKELVDQFAENAMSFENPREVEHKIFQFIYRSKVNGNGRENARRYLRRLQNLAKEDLSRSQESALAKLADSMAKYVSGETTKGAEEKGSRRTRKNSQMIPENVRAGIESALKNGYVIATIDDKDYKFGASPDNIYDLFDEDEVNAEMLERAINKCLEDGLTWKYKSKDDWKNTKLEDIDSPKWKNYS